MPNLYKLIISITVIFGAAALGSLATYPVIPTWYAGLQKPSFNPPNWLFGPVWTILYAMMAASFYLVWSDRRHNGSRRWAYIAFGIQLTLNVAWSVVFFGLQSPAGALMVIFALIAAIVATMRLFWPISRLATWLLLPYLVWVSFATILNVAIMLLN